ncbi:MAG: hypothetical protein JJE40_08835 [Vicinamibacteria bacterium]|nr:hypothetical protein [Vicinamibacteria bacterium]
MTISLQASPGLRSGVLIASLGVAVVEIGLFVMLWRVGSLVDPGADRHAALLFVALGSAVTLQAMGAVGVAWVVVAMSRTTLHADDTGVSLDHPWRRWHGAWTDVTHAWTQNGWLVLQVRSHWRRWYVRAGGDQAASLARVRAELPSGAWLEGSVKHLHLARTTLPIVLAATGVGGLIMLWALKALDTM